MVASKSLNRVLELKKSLDCIYDDEGRIYLHVIEKNDKLNALRADVRSKIPKKNISTSHNHPTSNIPEVVPEKTQSFDEAENAIARASMIHFPTDEVGRVVETPVSPFVNSPKKQHQDVEDSNLFTVNREVEPVEEYKGSPIQRDKQETPENRDVEQDSALNSEVADGLIDKDVDIYKNVFEGQKTSHTGYPTEVLDDIAVYMSGADSSEQILEKMKTIYEDLKELTTERFVDDQNLGYGLTTVDKAISHAINSFVAHTVPGPSMKNAIRKEFSKYRDDLIEAKTYDMKKEPNHKLLETVRAYLNNKKVAVIPKKDDPIFPEFLRIHNSLVSNDEVKDINPLVFDEIINYVDEEINNVFAVGGKKIKEHILLLTEKLFEKYIKDYPGPIRDAPLSLNALMGLLDKKLRDDRTLRNNLDAKSEDEKVRMENSKNIDMNADDIKNLNVEIAARKMLGFLNDVTYGQFGQSGTLRLNKTHLKNGGFNLNKEGIPYNADGTVKNKSYETNEPKNAAFNPFTDSLDENEEFGNGMIPIEKQYIFTVVRD